MKVHFFRVLALGGFGFSVYVWLFLGDLLLHTRSLGVAASMPIYSYMIFVCVSEFWRLR